MHHPRALEAVDGAQLGEAEGQLPVAAEARTVDRDVKRAVHRLQLVLHVLDLDRRVHRVLVVLGVPAGLPEVELRDVGAVDEVVPPREVLVAPEVLDLLPDEPALGVPEHEPRPGVLRDREQVQLAPQLPVVAALRFLEPMEVLLQLLLREERVPVDALHRGVALAALPVGGGGAGVELEGLDLPRRFEVRAQAEVHEAPHGVAPHGVARLLLDELALQGLPLRLEEGERLRLGDQLLLDGPVLLDDLRHLLLDGGEVLRGERPADQEVVKETVLGGRTDPALRVGKELGHRGREQVGRGVAVDLDRGVGRFGFARGSGVVQRFH